MPTLPFTVLIRTCIRISSAVPFFRTFGSQSNEGHPWPSIRLLRFWGLFSDRRVVPGKPLTVILLLLVRTLIAILNRIADKSTWRWVVSFHLSMILCTLYFLPLSFGR